MLGPYIPCPAKLVSSALSAVQHTAGLCVWMDGWMDAQCAAVNREAPALKHLYKSMDGIYTGKGWGRGNEASRNPPTLARLRLWLCPTQPMAGRFAAPVHKGGHHQRPRLKCTHTTHSRTLTHTPPFHVCVCTRFFSPAASLLFSMLVSVPRAQSGGTKWYQLPRSFCACRSAYLLMTNHPGSFLFPPSTCSKSKFDSLMWNTRRLYDQKRKMEREKTYFDSIKNNPTTVFLFFIFHERKKLINDRSETSLFPHTHTSHCCCCCYCRLWLGALLSLCVYYSSTHFISCVKYAENRRWRRPPDYLIVGLFITCHLGSSFELCVWKRDCAG